jgi:imidazolonepropionase-like amidohydrolase
VTQKSDLMRKSFVLVFPVLAILAAGISVADSTAFVNVNVLPMTSETVLHGKTVIVSDGVIKTIGDVADTAVPEGARVVDGTDRYLMPGLSEMHGHVPGATSGELDRVLSLFVANGVTTVRGMLGQPEHLELRKAIADGSVLGPRLYTSGPSFNGRSVASVDAAVRMVVEQHAAGYDFLKIHPGLSRAEFDAIAESAARLQIPFAGHVPEDVGVEAALDAGIASIDHLDGYMETLLPPKIDPSGGFGGFFGVLLADGAEESRIEPIALATAAAGVWTVPTESLFEHALSAIDAESMTRWPEMQYMPAATVEQWRAAKEDLRRDVADRPGLVTRAIQLRHQLILALHTAGAGLLLGADSPQIFNVPGFAVHRELQYLVDAGLSPYAALRTGTANPAEFFAATARFGTVQAGLDADLLLLDANPFDAISNTRRIHGVMLRGRWLDRRELDQLLGQFRRDGLLSRR